MVLASGSSGTDGLTAAAELHRQLPQCRTLILTALAHCHIAEHHESGMMFRFVVEP